MAVKLPDGVLPPLTNLKSPYDDRAAHVVMNVLHYEFKIEVDTVVHDYNYMYKSVASVYVFSIIKQN